MRYFFRPSSRIRVPLWLARGMNVMNMLGPVCLLLAIVVMVLARIGEVTGEAAMWLMKLAAWLVAAALSLRIIWGISIRLLYHHYKQDSVDRNTVTQTGGKQP